MFKNIITIFIIISLYPNPNSNNLTINYKSNNHYTKNV